MKNRLSKILILPALCGALGGCVAFDPPPTPEAIAAAQAAYAKIDWGVLKPYISQQYIDWEGNFLRIVPDPMAGQLLIEMYIDTGSAQPHKTTFPIKPTETRNTYLVTVPPRGWSGSQNGLIRIGDDGRAHVLDESLGNFQLLLTAQKAEIVYEHLKPDGLKRDVYSLPNGKTVPISYAADSTYQKLRAGKSFGTWENHVGKTFVGNYIGNLLTVSKDDAGNLVLTYTNLDNKNPRRAVISPPPKMQMIEANEVNNPATRSVTLTDADHLILDYYDDDTFFFSDRGSFQAVLIPRGDRIIRNGHQEWPDYQRQYVSGVYKPVTAQGVKAAAEYNEKQARLRALRRQEAAERAERRQSTESAIMAGLASGFAQGQQTANRHAQMSRDFERGLNSQLRTIDQQNKARSAAPKAASNTPKAGGSAASQAAARPTSTARAPIAGTASGGSTPSPAAKAPATQQAYTPAAATACRSVDEGEQKAYGYGPNRATAESNTRLGMCAPNRGANVISMQCKEEKQTMKVPVPGNPLKFTRQDRPSTWACNATYRCQQPKQVCEGSSRGVRQ